MRDQPIGVIATGAGSVRHAHLLRQWTDDVILFTDTHSVTAEEHATLDARGIAVVDGAVERLVVTGDRLRAIQLVDGRTFSRDALFIRPALRSQPNGPAAALGCDLLDGGLVRTDADPPASCRRRPPVRRWAQPLTERLSMDDPASYPLRLEGDLAPQLSRWLWLVKWILLIPHFVVLLFLWISFVALSVVALFAILFTGRYPRGMFEFNVGVMRWTWRVSYYSYSALGTDSYPPFTLSEAPEYPARLSVAYPQSLSRGKALVKWWLLAIPHYLIIGVFTGGAFVGYNEANGGNWWYGSGLIGLLVCIAGIALLFAGRYPRGLYDLVMGMNRWCFRVVAYAALMTDRYPPFRMDMGDREPPSGEVAATVGRAPLPAS